MSGLYSLRRAVREVLRAEGLWTDDEVIIKRRTNIWNDVAVATAASDRGECVVIGVATGERTSPPRTGRKNLTMVVTIPVTLIQLPEVDPAQNLHDNLAEDEDSRWERMVMALEGESLGRSALHYELDFDSFQDVEDEQYVIRQTVFKTRLILKNP